MSDKEQLDRMEERGIEQGEAIKEITNLLGGNKKLGQKGLMVDYSETKKLAYNNKQAISNMQIKVAGITTAIGLAWGAVVTWWNS